jgi:hypothetical protein
MIYRLLNSRGIRDIKAENISLAHLILRLILCYIYLEDLSKRQGVNYQQAGNA